MHLFMELIYFDIGLRFGKEDFTILFDGLVEDHPGMSNDNYMLWVNLADLGAKRSIWMYLLPLVDPFLA